MPVPGRAALLLVLAAGPMPALAVMQSVTESAVYAMSETDSRFDAKQKCSDNAKRVALDHAGSLFQATLSVDQQEGPGPVKETGHLKMQSTFAGVVSSEIVNSQLDVFGETTRISCEVHITYDPEVVTEKLRQIADAEQLRQQVSAQQRTIAALQQTPPIAAPSANFALPPSFTPPPVYAAASPPPAVVNPPPVYVQTAAAPPVYAPPPPRYQPPLVVTRAAAYQPPIYYVVPPRRPPRRHWIALWYRRQ